MLGASEMRVLKIRRRRANLLLLAQGRSRGLLLHKGLLYKAVVIRARCNIPKYTLTVL